MRPRPPSTSFPPIATSDRPRAADKAECRHDLQGQVPARRPRGLRRPGAPATPAVGIAFPRRGRGPRRQSAGHLRPTRRLCSHLLLIEFTELEQREGLRVPQGIPCPHSSAEGAVSGEETPPVLDIRKPVDEGEALRKRCGTAVGGQRRENPVEGVLVERRQEIVAQGCVIFVF